MKQRQIDLTQVNKQERIAGAFVVLAILLAVGLSIAVVVQKGWLSKRVEYHVELPTASGLHRGTQVLLSGLRAGWIESVEFKSVGKIDVTFSVFKKYQPYLTKGTQVQVIRPHIVGEKVLEIAAGEQGGEPLPSGSQIPSAGGIDLVDVLSGRMLGPLLDNVLSMSEEMRSLSAKMKEKGMGKSLVQLLVRLDEAIHNMSQMGYQLSKVGGTINKRGRLERLMVRTENITNELTKVIPVASKNSPEVLEQLPELVTQLTELSKTMNELAPMMQNIAPELPETSRRAAEALDESVVLMKAMQRFFFIDGKVKAVREEEAAERAKRTPAEPK